MSTVLRTVAEQVRRTPDALAALDPATRLSYGRLAGRANAVADDLRGRGVGRGDVVGVSLPRSVDQVAAMLGIWQVGAVYLPLDRTLPPARLDYQRRQAGLTASVADVPVTDRAEPLGAGEPRPADCAYVMFTSGSTGRPKAVQISHASLLHCVEAVGQLLQPGPADRYVANQMFSFDISLLEILLPLSSGGAVLVTGEALQADPRRLVAWVEAQGATVMHATPTAWRTLLRHLTPGRPLQAVSGGEVLTARLVADLTPLTSRVWNFYGPTEVTVWCTAGVVGPAEPDPLPVGPPLPGYRIEILDVSGSRVAAGEQGEIHVGGPGLAIGYGGAPELTAERFIDHVDLGRLYRTGDQGRWLPDGRLHFAGRTDRQVQVHGYRIELGEIETVAQEHPGVDLAAADVVDDTLLLFAQGSVTPRSLRRHLASHLPVHMVPSRLHVLPAFPLTPTNKIDRAALLAAADG